MMRPAAVVVALLCALALAPAQQYGWTGQQPVNQASGDTFQYAPTLVFDAGGVPMAVWARNRSDSSLVYSRWEAGGWTAKRPVGPDGPGVWGVSKPRMCRTDDGTVWLIWCNSNDGNTEDIAFRRWDGSAWSAEVQVNQPDSTEEDFSPRIATGGGEVWCVWYGGPTSGSPYVVYASRWDGASGRWEPETQVSPQNNAQNWFCDIAVDSLGTPHVVWLASLLYAVYYSRFDGTGWTAPELVNDTFRVKAASWGAPQVVIDRTGMLHTSFTGVRQGAASRDIFYTRNDGSGWTDCEMVSQDSAYSEWYSNIAADRPGNVWIAYDRQNEGPDQFRIYAQHYDGSEWSKEERLDDTTAYYDITSDLRLDSDRLPWAVWTGMPYAGAVGDPFYNRYVSPPGSGEAAASARRTGWLVTPTVCTRGRVELALWLAEPGRVSIELLDLSGRVRAAGQNEFHPAGPGAACLNADVPGGVYFLHVRAGALSDVRKVVIINRD